MIIQYITLFPEVFTPYFESGMLRKASQHGVVNFVAINLRDYGLGARHQVDDTPYGGGDGMLLRPEPLVAAIETAKAHDPAATVILPTPRGVSYQQSSAQQLATTCKGLILICPRYEGYDERITNWVDYQFCIGNYILTGGELPALTIIDSVVRLLPGVLGGAESAAIESFTDDNKSIEFPQYTRPEVFRDLAVPPILRTGNHAQIAAWRKSHSRPAPKARYT